MTLIFVSVLLSRWGGEVLKKVLYGGLRPEVQPLTLLHTIFSEKVPLSYTFY